MRIFLSGHTDFSRVMPFPQICQSRLWYRHRIKYLLGKALQQCQTFSIDKEDRPVTGLETPHIVTAHEEKPNYDTCRKHVNSSYEDNLLSNVVQLDNLR